MTPLPREFLDRPIAHRGLHDLSKGAPENSLLAFQAALAAGYGIELDVQPAADGTAMVFHDDSLDGLTDLSGPTKARSVDVLRSTTLLGTDAHVPTLAETLNLVAGQVPLLVEIKDQCGDPRTGTFPLVGAVLDTLAEYQGPVAVMSFNPFAVAHGAKARPDLPWGITTGHGIPLWPDHLPLDQEVIQCAPDPMRWRASFVSQGLHDIASHRIAALRRQGVPVLTWTVRSPGDEARARAFADNITFEGYRPAQVPPKA